VVETDGSGRPIGVEEHEEDEDSMDFLNLNLNLNCARANEIAYFKFPVCGRSTQASIQAYKHTHARTRNEVMLVWGSLRLAPIVYPQDYMDIHLTTWYANLHTSE